MLIKLLGFGFMLFAFFFGAGNLIFPIKLGWESGPLFNTAILGFLITGVGMPLMGVIAATLHKEGIAKNISEKINPVFAMILMIAIYLTIGPFFAIPRTASLCAEITNNILSDAGINFNYKKFLLLFSIIYFIVVFFISTRQSKLVDIIGKILAPSLLVLIIIICILSFFKLGNNINKNNFIQNDSLAIGLINGYQTMDALASVVFSTIIFKGIQDFLQENKINPNNAVRYCIYSSLIASLGLILTYLSLGWVGNHFYINAQDLELINNNHQHIGTYILIACSKLLLGKIGNIVITIIVTIACLTTAIGLVVATSNYFFNLTASKFNIKYYHYVLIFTFMSLILANQGLNNVIKTAIPILLILYPITLNILILLILNQYIKIPKASYYCSIVINIVINIFSKYIHILLNKINFSTDNIFLQLLTHTDFIWIIPTIIGFVIGILYNKIKH